MNLPYVRGIETQLADLKAQTNQIQSKLEQEREKRQTAEMKAAMLEARLQFAPATQQTQSIDPLDMLTRSFGIVEKVRNMAGIQEPAASAPSEAAAPANPLLEMGKEALGGFLQSDAGKEVMGEVFRGLAGGVMGGGGGTPSATGFRPARTQPRRDPAPQLQPTPQPQPRPAPQPQPQPRPAPQPQPQTSTPKRPPSRPAAPPAPPTPPPSPPKPAPRPVPQTIRLRLVENEATSPTVAPSEAPQTPSAPLAEAVPASISTTPTAPFAEDKLAWLGILEEAVESDTHPLVLREMVDAETLDNLRAFPPDMLLMVLKSNLPEGSPLLTEKEKLGYAKRLKSSISTQNTERSAMMTAQQNMKMRHASQELMGRIQSSLERNNGYDETMLTLTKPDMGRLLSMLEELHLRLEGEAWARNVVKAGEEISTNE